MEGEPAATLAAIMQRRCHRRRRRRSRRDQALALPFRTAVGLLVAVLCALTVASAAHIIEPDECDQQKIVIGIDLGTTYSAVGIVEQGQVKILPNELGNRITPSVVAWPPGGGRLIGEAAKNQAMYNGKNTVSDIKRIIGRSFHDKIVQEERQNMPFKIVNNEGKPHVRVSTGGQEGTTDFSPEEISSMILGKMASIAEAHLGYSVTEAVITVPAYFNDAQRQATKDAAAIAGLDVLRIINEPTAAALAYGLDETTIPESAEKNVLVFDLGGGTFDVTLMTIDNGVFEVLATSGSTHLGGEDFDNRVVSALCREFAKRHGGLDPCRHVEAREKLRAEAERAKRALSSQLEAQIEVENMLVGEQNFSFSFVLTRTRFEEINLELFKQTLDPVRQVLEDAELSNKEVDEVVIVGGSTRIPKVRELLRDFFDGKQLNEGIDADEAVARGAALLGSIFTSACSRDQPPVLLDLTPLTLGIETHGGTMAPIMRRNTPIPSKRTQTFTTASDNQQEVRIQIFEGERAFVRDNHLLGTFVLSGIPPAPRGVPQIEVSFDVDVDGILHASARDLTSGSTGSITLSSDKSGMSESEIQRHVAEAARLAKEDSEALDRVTAQSDLERFSYLLRHQLEEGELPQLDDGTLEREIAAVLSWLDDHPHASAHETRQRHLRLEAMAARD